MLRPLALLVALGIPPLLQGGPDDSKLPKDPIQDWKYRLRDVARVPKPGHPGEFVEVEEITLLLEGKEAIPVKSMNRVFDLRGVRGKYYTLPEKDKISKEIRFEAKRGRFDQEARTLKLEDDVHVAKNNDEDSPPQAPTLLVASSALLRFNQMYECPMCKKLLKAPGRCLDHDALLKPTTITSVEADRAFSITGPEGTLSGEGLMTDDAIDKEYHITRNGFAEFGGGAGEVPGEKKPSAATPEVKFSQIYSKGPLHITGPKEQRTLRGEGGVRVDRIDSSGTLTLTGRTMTIETRRDLDPKTGSLGEPEVRNVDAEGDVEVEAATFEDGSFYRSRSDSLVRRLQPQRRRHLSALKLERSTLASPERDLVRVSMGPSTIDSHRVTLTREVGKPSGISIFERVERSSLSAGTQHFDLQSDRLETFAAPDQAGKTDLRELRAYGHVVLGGLLAGAKPAPPAGEEPGARPDPGEARADTFIWDVEAKRGWLEATPLVRITQGQSLITAPKVVLESPDIWVLKGPKSVHMKKPAEAGKEAEDYLASCGGDLVLDQETHRLWMWDDCKIRTKEMTLLSDRVDAKLAQGGSGQGLESLLALGRAHAVQEKDHMNLYGSRLAYRFADKNLKVFGEPYAIADTGRMVTTQHQIRVYEALSPRKTAPVRYTEMEGSSEGVTIEIVDRPPTNPPGRKK